jgi:hypothetical protein
VLVLLTLIIGPLAVVAHVLQAHPSSPFFGVLSCYVLLETCALARRLERWARSTFK